MHMDFPVHLAGTRPRASAPRCRSILAAGLAALLAACTSKPSQLQPVTASPGSFSVCSGYGCRDQTKVGLDGAEWQSVRAIMSPPAATPELERGRISLAVARLETLVGARTGTSADLGGTFEGAGRAGQMDCLDESSNTRVYLSLLWSQDLLTWHRPYGLAHRGLLIDGNWPHTTAVIATVDDEQRYTVDSWFYDNGETPVIISLASWQDGWSP